MGEHQPECGQDDLAAKRVSKIGVAQPSETEVTKS